MFDLKSNIKKRLGEPGLLGFLSSLLYFSYGCGLKEGIAQAYNRQGFDLRYGTDTFSVDVATISKLDKEVYADSALAVDATSDKVERVQAGFNFIRSIITHSLNDCLFVDFGCGKGRTLILARNFGFARLVGIELSPYVLNVCRKNLSLLSVDSMLIRSSIRDVDFSSLAAGVTSIVIYAYNPTTPELIQEACEGIRNSFPEKTIHLIYTNPQGVFDSATLLHIEDKLAVYSF